MEKLKYAKVCLSIQQADMIEVVFKEHLYEGVLFIKVFISKDNRCALG